MTVGATPDLRNHTTLHNDRPHLSTDPTKPLITTTLASAPLYTRLYGRRCVPWRGVVP